MTRRVLSHDPVTGTTTYFDYTSDDKMVITESQNVSGTLKEAHAMMVDEDRTAKGIKGDMWHYARLPNVVIYEMLTKHGVDANNPQHRGRFFKLLNTEYKQFKTTHKNHSVKNA